MHEVEALAVMFHGERSAGLHQCLAKVALEDYRKLIRDANITAD